MRSDWVWLDLVGLDCVLVGSGFGSGGVEWTGLG